MSAKKKKRLWANLRHLEVELPEADGRAMRRATSPQGRIGECGKQEFTSENQARQAARARLNKRSNTHRFRPYKCPVCHKWHLTSQSSF